MSSDGSKKSMTEVILGPNNRKKRKEELKKAEADPNYIPDLPPKKSMTEMILGPDNRKLREQERQLMLQDPTYVPTVPEKKTMTEMILGPNNRKKRKEEAERLQREALLARQQAQLPPPQQVVQQQARPRILCPYCGGENDNPYRFCNNCGRPSPQIQPLEAPVTEPTGMRVAPEQVAPAQEPVERISPAPAPEPIVPESVQATPEPVVQLEPVVERIPATPAEARQEPVQESRIVERPPVAPVSKKGFGSKKKDEEERLAREARLEEYRANRRAAMVGASNATVGTTAVVAREEPVEKPATVGEVERIPAAVPKVQPPTQTCQGARYAVYHAASRYLESMEDHDGLRIFVPGSDSEKLFLDTLSSNPASIKGVGDDRSSVMIGDDVSLYFMVRLGGHKTLSFYDEDDETEEVRFDLM